MLRCAYAYLVLALSALPTGASGADPVRWLHTPTMMEAPDTCIGFGRLLPPFYTPSDICPDPQGSLLIRSNAALPRLLLQTSARGHLSRIGGAQPADSARVGGAFMSQALSARELSDGDTLVMTADLNAAPTRNGQFRPALTLFDSEGSARWTVPVSALLGMSSRDGRAGFVAELSPGGDLLALLQTEVLTALRLRRSDGRVEARTVYSTPFVATRAADAEALSSSGDAYSSVPFQAWLGASGLHVLTTYRWLTLDPVTLAVRANRVWSDQLAGTNLFPSAVAAIEGSDDMAMLAYGPYLSPKDQNCTLLRMHASGAVVWSVEIDECAPEKLLEPVGDAGLVFPALRYEPFRRELIVANVATGAIERQIAVSDRPRRLASTPTTTAYLAYSDTGLALHGVDLATGSAIFQRPFEFPADSELLYPTESLEPSLAAHGGDSFVVHGGRSQDFKSLGFAAYVLDAQSGNIRQHLKPVPLALTTRVSILAQSADSLILSESPQNGAEWPQRIERLSRATGERLWVHEENPIWDRSSVRIQANEQHVLIVEQRRLYEPDRWQLQITLRDALSGSLAYVVSRTLEMPAWNANFHASLASGGLVMLGVAANSGLQEIGLNASGDTAWQVDFPATRAIARTDRGRWLLSYVAAGAEQLGLLSAVDGSVSALGQFDSNQTVHSATEIGDNAHDVWLLSSRVAAGQNTVSAQRRRVDTGALWTHDSAFPTAAVVLVLASAILPDQDLVYELRSNISAFAGVTRRTLRLDGLSGAVRWDHAEQVEANVATGCRAFLPASNGDVLCVEAYGRATDAMSGVDPALTYVRRLDGVSGELIGVHWLSIESDALRGFFHGEGPSSRTFLATGNAGFAYTGPATGERAFTTGAVGWIDSPTIAGRGDVSVQSSAGLEGFSFSIRNDSSVRADAIRWTVDASTSAAIDSLNCSGNTLAGALIKPFGAQGAVDLGPGESAQCELHWLPSVPALQRKATVFAWPAYDYLDTNPGNNVSVALGEALFADGFESSGE